MTIDEVRVKAAEAAKEAIANATTEVEQKEIFDSALKDAPHREKDAWKKAGSFIKALGTNNDAVLKDLSVGVNANGGYLAPIEFAGMLIEKLYKMPVIRPLATKMPMSSDQMQVPLETTTPSTNWTPELTAITQSDPTFGQLTLLVNELIGISRMSRQFLLDADVQFSMTDWVIGRFAKAIGRAEDTAFMVGSGSGQPKGIRQYTLTNAVAQVGTTVGSLTGDDLINLVYSIGIQYREDGTPPVFLVPDSKVAQIRKLKDSSGRYLWSDNFESGGLVQAYRRSTILGFPVLVQNDIPTNLGGGANASEIYFGRLDYYLIGDRDQIFSEVSTEEGTSFAQHRAAVKVGERIDGQLSLTDPFSKLTGVL